MKQLPSALAGAAIFVLFLPRAADARPITLQQALALADESPAVQIAGADVEEARARAQQAGKYTYNPAIFGSSGPVFGSDRGTLYDYEVGISQAIELGGKRGARKRAAAADRDAAMGTHEATRIALRAEIRRAFDVSLVANARLRTTAENETAAKEFAEAARERLRLGAATQTEVNVAIASLGRAIAANKSAQRDLLVARQALGDALGIADADLQPSGAMPTFPAPPTAEDKLVAEALQARRDLAAAERTRAARAADVDLADALAVPDPEISVAWARSAVEESDAVVVGLRLELPLWNRNQGNRGAARAARRRATIDVEAMRRGVEREVRVATRRYRVATEAVAAFDQQVVGTLAENLKLARETLAAGKMGLLDLNNVRRDLVESQLTYLDSISEAVEARAALERAIGRLLEGTTP